VIFQMFLLNCFREMCVVCSHFVLGNSTDTLIDTSRLHRNIVDTEDTTREDLFPVECDN
jgi:hypothetical protein